MTGEEVVATRPVPSDLMAEMGMYTLSDEEKTIEQQVEEMMELHPKKVPRKFMRIRTFVQKLNEEYIVTLYEAEQRHKAEVKALRDELESQDEKNEALQYKIKTLLAQEQEHLVLVKQAGERIRKLEAQEENHKLYVKKAGEKIAFLESQARKHSSTKLKEMEAREEKVIALAKKAAAKIKELEAREKKHAENAKKAALNIKRLKEMLLDKHDELVAFQKKTFEELDGLAHELVKANTTCVNLKASLEQARNQYLEEHELRRADQKKITSLRTMIEQYDDGVDCNWSDLAQAFSDESQEVNALVVYRGNPVTTKEELDQLKEKIYASIPDSTKKHFQEVGFFATSDYHFPVLALSPFDVPPGAIRDKWLEKANTSLGVYYYGQTDKTLAYDLIPAESFIPFEEGAEKGFHVVPDHIIEKIEAGVELSPLEHIFEEGIKKINIEADADPDWREHPLKNFKELYEGDEETSKGESIFNTELTSEELLSKLKEKLCSCSVDKEQLLQELDQIQEEAPKPSSTRKEERKEESEAEESKPMEAANLNVVFDDDEEEEDDEDDDGRTMTSLEEQMHNFMADLNATKNRKTPTPRAGDQPTFFEEPTVEARESNAPEEKTKEETRDDVVIEPKHSYEKIPSSLVAERLKMFNGNHSDKHSKTNVIPVGYTKNVRQMWKKKASVSVNTTPKHGNTNKTGFNFDDTVRKEDEKSVSSGKSTRCVTIPKNIVKKVEAGEALSDHERKILVGIQKYNNVNDAASSEQEDVVVPQTSTLSTVTNEGDSNQKSPLPVSAE